MVYNKKYMVRGVDKMQKKISDKSNTMIYISCIIFMIVVFGCGYISNNIIRNKEKNYEIQDVQTLEYMQKAVNNALQEDDVKKELDGFMVNSKVKNFYIGSSESQYEYLKKYLPLLYSNINDATERKIKSMTAKSYGIRAEIDEEYNCTLKICDWSTEHNIIRAQYLNQEFIAQ